MDVIDYLLVRYLTDTATPEERAEVERWLREPENSESFERMRASWGAWSKSRRRGEAAADRYQTAAEWERLIERVRDPNPQPVPKRRPRGVAPWLRWAAAAVLVIGGAALWPPAREVFRPTATLESHATAVGQRSRLQFSDGSLVMLGPESELRFPSRPRRGTREVYLEGAAYFEVARDARRPFVVHAGDAVTTVLGTRFVVRAYADEGTVDVGVSDGSVAVRAEATPEADAVTLERGERARVMAGGAAHRVENGDVDALLGWTEGRLVFRDTPVTDVLRELERWFDVEIRLADSALADGRLNLFVEHRSLDRTLAMIALALGGRYEWVGRTVTLLPGEDSR